MRHRTFWRVYLHGLLLLALAGIAIFAVGRAFGRPHPDGPRRIAAAIAQSYAPLLDDPAALQAEVDATHDSMGIDIAVRRRDGSLVAWAGQRAPEIPPGAMPGPGRGPRKPRLLREHDLVVAPIGRPPEALLVMDTPRWPVDLRRPAAILAAALLALAVGSIPLARSIASPIERLTRTVRRFGQGDLSARTGVAPGTRGGEVAQLAAAFDEMAERIEALIRSEKELLANVSHELRTPLARIRIALELAAEGDRSGGRYLREIETDLAELESMIEDVLAAARLDLADRPGGAPPLRKAPVEAKELVDGAVARFSALHPGRRLEVEAAGDLPTIEADAAMLRRALVNLLDNAAKYSDEAIRLVARCAEGRLVIEVRDRGIGIDEADLPHLFTPFFRTDRSRARGTGGVGLGLALARRIVEAHGGTIEAESRRGEGTTMRILLPAAECTGRKLG